MAKKTKETLGFQEAVENLLTIQEIHLEDPPSIGIFKKNRLTINEGEFPKKAVEWISGEGTDSLLEVLDATYFAVHNHLRGLYEDPNFDFDLQKNKEELFALMALVGESAQKMESYIEYRLGKPLATPIQKREIYKALKEFFSERFEKKLGQELFLEEDSSSLKRSLQELSAVKKDVSYELFSIKDEEGAPYFEENFLNNLKVKVDFGQDPEAFEEDPFLKVKTVEDRDLQVSATQILQESYKTIGSFLKISKRYPESHFVKFLNFSIYALFLAANPRNLIQNSLKKSCTEYFHDFYSYLRNALKSHEYQKLIAYPPEKSDREAHLLLETSHRLAFLLFQRKGGVKQEAIGLIHRTMRKGEEVKKAKKKALYKGENLWNQLTLSDEDMREFMDKFPNGPLFKVIDTLRQEQDLQEIIPFDPSLNFLPSHILDVELHEKIIHFLRFSCPTRQSLINKAEITEEFRGYLRSLKEEKRSHLFINLQDRNSWKEAARCKSLEVLSKNAEFSDTLFLLTLPKEGDFYHQAGKYQNIHQAKAFKISFQEELFSDTSGFYFPPKASKEKMLSFFSPLFDFIHEQFYDAKNTLTRREREDFIEIFYQFLIFHFLDLVQPDYASFCCKDGVDTSASQLATFYGFLKILSGGLEEKEDVDFLRYLFYQPALFVRERALDAERFHRSLACLEELDFQVLEKGKAFSKAALKFINTKNIHVIPILKK